MSNARRTLALCAAGLAAAAAPALAFNPQPEPPAFGMMGLARTQMAILSAVLTQPPDPVAPPCAMVLSFVDANGNVFHDAAGNEVSRRVDLRGNVAAFLQLRSQDVIPDGQIRVAIHAVVQPPDPAQPPDPQCVGLVATVEIVDLFGFTRILESSQIQPPDPQIPPDPQ